MGDPDPSKIIIVETNKIPFKNSSMNPVTPGFKEQKPRKPYVCS
jgi:hypothetical protein